MSYAVSLCTHEQSWLVVGYLILFDLLVFAPAGRFRGAVVQMWREAWIWLGYLFLTILAMVNYFDFYYAPLKPRATFGRARSATSVCSSLKDLLRPPWAYDP